MMRGAYSTHGRMLEIYTKFWSGNIKGKDNLNYICVDEKILLKWL
jgi:hypothetical protein